MKRTFIFLGGIIILLITACSPLLRLNAPFEELNVNSTQAAQTVEAMLTQSSPTLETMPTQAVMPT